MISTQFPEVRDKLTRELLARLYVGRSVEISNMRYEILADPPLHPAFLRTTFEMSDGDVFFIDTEEQCEPIAQAVTDGHAQVRSGVLH